MDFTLPITMTLRRTNGEERDFVFRQCRLENLEQILAVQNLVKAGLERTDIFAMTSREEFQESLEKDVCLGAFCRDELALVSLLLINRVTPRHLGSYLGYDEAALLRSATYDTTFVHPAYRGFGLQALGIQIKDSIARDMGVKEILATISPYNPRSLENARAQGFLEVKRCRMYGGLERFLVKKTL